AGIVFALTKDYLFLLLAALIGTINVTGTEVGPFLSIEQAMIPQTCAERRRTSAFALYSFVGTFATAAGALLSGVPELLQGFGMGLEASFRPLFLAYALLGVATAGLFLLLSPATEMRGGERGQPLGPGTKRIVTRLSLLFSLDSFAGGFVIQSLVAYWFFTRFGVPLRDLSLLFFWANILTALSFFAAAKLAGRVGLVNTMVFTHLPSNVLLMLVPLAPSFPLAMALYLGRMAISQMDVPTRQSYIVAIVAPEERTAAAGMTNIARNLAQAVGPSVAGYALTLSLAAPFLIGGGLKVIYDLALYFSFRGDKAA
ncbi:MAG: MFS transporter, partial [Candidatus Hydrothermarchaeota archaeon]